MQGVDRKVVLHSMRGYHIICRLEGLGYKPIHIVLIRAKSSTPSEPTADECIRASPSRYVLFS